MRRLVALLLVLAPVATARAEDVPVAGERLLLRPRRATVTLVDPAIAAPFVAPAGGSVIVAGGAGAGQCHFETRLEADGWRELRGDGEHYGYFYRGERASGIDWILLRPGRVSIHGNAAAWGCNLTGAQRQPLRAELRFDERRYCAVFTDAMANAGGRYLALFSDKPDECAKTDVTAVTLNILHGVSGLGCSQTANCRLAERVELLFRWIQDHECPDVATFQEVSTAAAAFIQQQAEIACPFAYNIAYQRITGVDDAIILSRYPIVATEQRPLQNNFRRVTMATIDHPTGPLQVFTTHLASGSDGASTPCGANCAAACIAAGAPTIRDCQAVQTAAYVAERHAGIRSLALLTGDFNESPGSFVYQQFTGRGWRDVYFDAGNPECEPSTGVGCTSGRADEELTELESPESNESERIDYIFLVPPLPASPCTGAIDPALDEDGDGIATRLFTDDPNPFVAACGPAPLDICWPSDHEGVELDVNCGSF